MFNFSSKLPYFFGFNQRLVRDGIMLLSTYFQARTVCKYGFVLKMRYHVVSQTLLSLEFLLNVLAFK